MSTYTEYTIPTATQADTYIATRYTTLNPLRVRWTVLDTADKEAYINQSSDQISKLPFNEVFDEDDISNIDYDVVFNAIIENAIGLLDADLNATSNIQFKTLQSMGMAKNTKYNRREQGDVLGINKDTSAPKAAIPIASQKAWDMIKTFTYGARLII